MAIVTLKKISLSLKIIRARSYIYLSYVFSYSFCNFSTTVKANINYYNRVPNVKH